MSKFNFRPPPRRSQLKYPTKSGPAKRRDPSRPWFATPQDHKKNVEPDQPFLNVDFRDFGSEAQRELKSIAELLLAESKSKPKLRPLAEEVESLSHQPYLPSVRHNFFLEIAEALAEKDPVLATNLAWREFWSFAWVIYRISQPPKLSLQFLAREETYEHTAPGTHSLDRLVEELPPDYEAVKLHFYKLRDAARAFQAKHAKMK